MLQNLVALQNPQGQVQVYSFNSTNAAPIMTGTQTTSDSNSWTNDSTQSSTTSSKSNTDTSSTSTTTT